MTFGKILRTLPLLFFSTAASATTLAVSFTSSLLTATGGQTVTFSATLTNTLGTTLFLNGDNTSIAGPLTLDDTKFFLNTPASLSAGQSITVPILDVIVPKGAPSGLYPGSFTVLGGPTDRDFTNIGSANFAVNVVPEPGTVGLLASGALLLLGLRRAHPRRN
jgi:hypothetical protein